MHRAYHPSPKLPERRIRWRRLLPWLAVVYALTGLYSVQPNERAVVRRFGKALSQTRGPGLHLGLPYGLDRVSRVKVLEQKQAGVGMSRWSRVLGRRIEPRQTECLTGDRNVILLSANVQYQVADVDQYLFNVGDVPALVENVAAGALCSVISSMEVDDILTAQREAIQVEVRRRSQARLDEYGAGVRVNSVLLDERTEPPQEVRQAFRDVTAAREDRQRAVSEAQGYANRLKQQAEADADGMIQKAQGYAHQITALAAGDADRFSAMAAELDRGRELTFKRLILETMEQVLPRLKKIVLDEDAAETIDLGLIEENR